MHLPVFNLCVPLKKKNNYYKTSSDFSDEKGKSGILKILDSANGMNVVKVPQYKQLRFSLLVAPWFSFQGL